MLKLCLTDKLIIRPVNLQTPWNYRIRYISLAVPVTVAVGNTISASNSTVTLTEAVFGDYLGKELLVEITKDGVVLERDTFLISGIYNKIESIKRLTQLLGENIKKLAEDSSDWQDGHLRSQDVTTYTSNLLTTSIDQYAWNQTFSTDFTPDARYQTVRVSSKEAT